MLYATSQNIVDRLPNGQEGLVLLADRDGDGVADEAVVSGALQDASDEIDTYVGVVYALPLPSVPAVLTRLCVDIAVYRMGRDASRGTEEDRKRYDDAVDLLKRIADKRASLGPVAPGESAPAPASVAEFSAQPRRFVRGKMP